MGGKDDYDRWFSRPLNNAQLNTIASYYQWVPRFHELLTEQGGDLEKILCRCAKAGPAAGGKTTRSSCQIADFLRALIWGQVRLQPDRREGVQVHPS